MTLPGFIDAQLIVSILVILIVLHVILLGVAYMIYLERKISAYIQDRLGPNRTGFDFGLPVLKKLFAPLGATGLIGLGQPLADGLKFLLKEDYMPTGADRYLFTLAPAVIIIPALIGFAVIPWGGTVFVDDISLFGLTIPGGEVLVAGANINVGIIYILAVASVGIYGIVLGGWASNNKYSFLGGLRASAQMISYEVPLGLSVLAILLLTGTLLPSGIIDHQRAHGWLVFSQPLIAVLFYICLLAENNRLPFDNAEAESELVGGYHTEYSSMRFALFFLAEYAHMVTGSAFFVLLFMGGWMLSPIGGLPIIPDGGSGVVAWLFVFLKAFIFFGKVALLVCFTMVVRWSIPRLRWDQVMQTAWQGAIPLALALTVGTAFMVHWEWTGAWQMLAFNVVATVAVVLVLASLPRSERSRRLPMAGSRFSPLPGEHVRTAPTSPEALDPRPLGDVMPVVSTR